MKDFNITHIKISTIMIHRLKRNIDTYDIISTDGKSKPSIFSVMFVFENIDGLDYTITSGGAIRKYNIFVPSKTDIFPDPCTLVKSIYNSSHSYHKGSKILYIGSKGDRLFFSTESETWGVICTYNPNNNFVNMFFQHFSFNRYRFTARVDRTLRVGDEICDFDTFKNGVENNPQRHVTSIYLHSDTQLPSVLIHLIGKYLSF